VQCYLDSVSLFRSIAFRSIVGTLIAGLLTKPGGHTPGATPPGKPARQQGGGAALYAANLRAQWYLKSLIDQCTFRLGHRIMSAALTSVLSSSSYNPDGGRGLHSCRGLVTLTLANCCIAILAACGSVQSTL
jgi:hypothetical protein